MPTVNTTHIIAAVLMTLGGLLALANWWSVIWSNVTKRFHSAVPFVGAALLGAGMLMLPTTRAYTWTALILDYGTLAFLLASPRLIREVWSTSHINLICEYLGEKGMKTVHLRLFRRGIFTIRLRLDRPPGECGLTSTGTIGTWQREGARLELHTERESAVFDVIRDRPTEVLRQSAGFTTWESSHELSLANIEFVTKEKHAA